MHNLPRAVVSSCGDRETCAAALGNLLGTVDDELASTDLDGLGPDAPALEVTVLVEQRATKAFHNGGKVWRRCL